MSLFIICTIISAYIFINQLGTRRLIGRLHKRYVDEATALIENKKISKEIKEASKLKEEQALLQLIALRRKPDFDLSLIISYLEFTLIAGATFLIIISTEVAVLNYDTLSKVGIVSLSWIGIKVLGYHGHWGQPIFGRSIFSVFLIGSVINMLLAFLAGWSFSLIP